MKRIVVPCNFSSHSERALSFAIEIAKITSGEIFIATVLSPPADSDNPSLTNQREEQTIEQYRDFILKFDTGDLQVSHHIMMGKITTSILDFIHQQHIDLVIMGTKGSRGWNDAFMGSNIGKLVRTAPIPVLAIKHPTSVKQIRNIVFPCSLETVNDVLIDSIKQLQEVFGAKIHLLFVNVHPRKSNDEGLNGLKKIAEKYSLQKFSTHALHNEVEKDGILEYVKEINAEMIAMGTHGNRNPDKMYVSSIAADITNYAPMLTWTCPTDIEHD